MPHSRTGGSYITPHGYRMINVGKSHHLADVRGFAYEHRIVAEKMLGRRLRPDEDVHHRNGRKAENRPSNLKVVAHGMHSWLNAERARRDREGRFAAKRRRAA